MEFIREHASIIRDRKLSREYRKNFFFEKKRFGRFACLAPFRSSGSVVEEEKKNPFVALTPFVTTPGKCVETDIYLLSKQGKRVYSDIFVSKTRGGDASLLPDAAKKSITGFLF